MQRKLLNINGVDREVLCDPEKDSLADVVRRLGLTGTKIGCGTGQCGSCTLLLDGKVVRSCTRKMKKVSDYSKVETIEGLGTPKHPHPLQQAFITYAAIQCGFCTPGFIMSAKGLLSENPSPTREEVRDWFTRHNNICRCTGYKPIVDAVMEAAAVMRGEKSMDDITFHIPADGGIYNTHFPKPTGMIKVQGNCDYGADISLKMRHDTLHLAVVMSRTHHAGIKRIDCAEAESLPGVVRVITAKDVKGTNRFVAAQGAPHSLCDGRERPILCEDKVFRFGDVVAVVAAATREQARDAAAKIKVEYEQLHSMLTFMDAVAPDAIRVHGYIPNVYMELPLYKGEDTRDMFDAAAYAVEGHFSTTRQAHLPIEPDVVIAYPDDGGVAIQCKAQYTHGMSGQMAEGIGLPKDKIRIINNPAGGSFGYSMSPANYALVAVCALALNTTVSLVLSYEEHQHMTGKRSPVYTNARLACTADGKMQALDFLVGIDHGAFSEMAGALTTKVIRFFGYPYNVPNIRGLARTAFTNGNFGIAFQAFGSPQAYMASEQLVDMLADKIGMDPFEFRYINVAQPGDFCTNSVPYREYPMRDMMDMMRPYYEEAKVHAAAESTPEVKIGVGLSWGGYHVSKVPDRAEVDLELNQDGTVTVYTTWADVGQGMDLGTTVEVHEALRPLALHPDQIRMVHGDTAICPDTGPSSGSRSHHVAGLATIDAANKLLDAMRKPDGTFRTWQEMRDEGIETRHRGVYSSAWPDIDPDTGHGYGAIAQNYVLTLVEVAVDQNTGKATVLHATILADVGKIGSYHGVLGQAWGAFARALGFALSERYDDMKKHVSILSTGTPKCKDVPDDINVLFHVTPRGNGPWGSTGCAEGFQSSAHTAILNAIARATGIRIFTLPATPDKIKAAMDAQKAGRPYEQQAWDLGCDLYTRLDELKEEHPKSK